jgi:two-component system capsular synthesis response regulator RcsB
MNDFKVRVILADDHPGMIAGVGHELSSARTIELAGSATNSAELFSILEHSHCDVLVSDYAMPAEDSIDGITLFAAIQRRYPTVKLVVLTMLDSPNIINTLIARNINCIVSKSDAINHLIPAIHAAFTEGKYYSPCIRNIIELADRTALNQSAAKLSPRELEVVRLYTSGLGISEIAERLNRSKKTISTQKVTAMKKLGIEREVDLLRYAIENGLISSFKTSIDDEEPDPSD